MQKTYKGFQIEIHYGLASVVRESDNWILGAGIIGSDDYDDPVFCEETMLDNCRSVVDEYLEHPERFEDEEDDPRPGDWKPYEGDYEKEEYDIRLQDNRIVKNCWPNAGDFHVLLGETRGETIPGTEVKTIRVSKPTSFAILNPEIASHD